MNYSTLYPLGSSLVLVIEFSEVIILFPRILILLKTE